MTINISGEIWICITTGLFTLIAAWLGSWHTLHAARKSETRQNRRVGLAIMKAFNAEIHRGVENLERAYKSGETTQLPDKTWEAYRAKLTIPIIDVYLQCQSESKQCSKSKNSHAFSSCDFLMHLKNYYEYIGLHARQFSKYSQQQQNDLLNSAREVEKMTASIVNALQKYS
jgi:hypothetical protein